MAGGKKSKNDRDRKRKKGGGRDSSVARQVRQYLWGGRNQGWGETGNFSCEC